MTKSDTLYPMRIAYCAFFLSLSAMAADPITAAFKARLQTQKLNFTETAAAVPEDMMAYRLTPDQRSVGDWLEHTADMNYRMCSQIAGVPAPKDTGVQGVQRRGKAAIEKAVGESFAYCESQFASFTDAKALAEVQAGNRKLAAVDVMFSLIANLNAHYGNLVGYMRVKGIVPPSTARTNNMKKK